MSVNVYINGEPSTHYPGYEAALHVLGSLPDESEHQVHIWTHAPQIVADGDSIWINPPTTQARENWVHNGGIILESSIQNEATEDRFQHRDTDIRVRSSDQAPVNPEILAAFLAHNFPAIDALMLTRAFRGTAWPDDLSHYPTPISGPKSDIAFASFPRNAGLYAVVPDSEWVSRLSQIHVPVVQLRDKRGDQAQRITDIRHAVTSVAGTGTLLFINDDWPHAIEHGAYGVHLGQEDIDSADLNAIHAAGLRLGISTHGIYEMLRAHACKPSYMALGAIYATPTKSMPTAPQGLRRLEHYVRLMSPHYPLVAIGGIDTSRVEPIWSTGIDCVAVVRAVVDAADYRQSVSEIIAKTSMTHCMAGAQ